MEKDIRRIKWILTALLLIIVAYILKVLAFMFIPLALAMFITLLFYPVLTWFNTKGIQYFLGAILLALAVSGIFWFMGYLVDVSATQMVERQHEIREDFINKVGPIVEWVNSKLPYSEEEGNDIQSQIMQVVSPRSFINLTGDIASEFGSFASGLLMMVIYLVIFLSGVKHIRKYLSFIYGDNESSQDSYQIFNDVTGSLSSFLKVKVLISLATGILFGLICWFFGVDFPIFWGLLTFLLNFIQVIGSVVVTLLLVIFGYLQIDTLSVFIFFAALLVSLQFLVGNVLEPYFMGRQFSLSTATVIIGLVLWGYLWGIAGMLLSVPIIVFIVSILRNTKGTERISRLLVRPNYGNK